MSDLISRKYLYEKTAEWEAQALHEVEKHHPEEDRDKWLWWSAVLKERTAFKFDVADAPSADHWTPIKDGLPDEKGEYLVTYHPCYWNNVDYETKKVGTDTFRGKRSWAKKKHQRVIAWCAKPEPYTAKLLEDECVIEGGEG